MFDDGEFLMISALQHYRYCPRQFALIHLEGYWKENYYTSDGRCLHRRVDLPGNHRSARRRVEYALQLSSKALGICGTADAVEFCGGNEVVPVEYKRGKAKADDCDRVQLCAQAFCLEEMLDCEIPTGGLFYFETRERLCVPLDDDLRTSCREAIAHCRQILDSGKVPCMSYERKRCAACSLLEYCMPPRVGLGTARAAWEEAMR